MTQLDDLFENPFDYDEDEDFLFSETLSVILLECFYISSRKECSHCEALIQSEEFKNLDRLHEILGLNVPYYYFPRPCDWFWMYEKRYTDRKVEESNNDLKPVGTYLEYENFLLAERLTKYFPTIVLHLFYMGPNGERYERKKLEQLKVVDDNGVENWTFFDMISSYILNLPGAVDPVKYFQHEKAGKSKDDRNALKKYMDRKEENEDTK